MRNRRFSAWKVCVCLMVMLALITQAVAQRPARRSRKRVQPETPRRGGRTEPADGAGKRVATEQQNEENALKDAAVAKFVQKYGTETRVDWNRQTGLPTLVYNFSTPKAVKDDFEAARQFISESRDFFLKGEDVDNLRARPKREGGGAVHIDFQQVYREVPVWDAVLSVHLAGENIIMVNGLYIPDINLDTTPAVSADAAVETAKHDIGANALLDKENPRPELVINVRGVKPLLCWRVLLQSLSPLADWEYFIDATSGAVVSKNDRSRRATGNGFIYPDNPVVTPAFTIGTFNNLDGSGVLRGSFANVRSFQGFDPSGTVIQNHEAVSPALSFGSVPEQRPFSEQMVYYHMNRAHDFFKSLGFNGLDIQVPATVHYRESDSVPFDGSLFMPTRNSMFFGDGSGQLLTGSYNSSFDAEIVLHEYAHAVIYNKLPTLGDLEESYGKAMDEGFADYFAGSSFNTPVIGQWAKIPSPQEIRRLDNNHRFPNHINHPTLGIRESHYTGLIWSGGLWDIRAALGPAIADRVILNSIDFLPRGNISTFQVGLQALIVADIALRGGADVAIIRQKMNARGIFEPGLSIVGDSQFSALHHNTPQSGTIATPPVGFCLLALNKQFSIYVPPGTSSLTVEASGGGDINLYVRFGSAVTIENNAIVSNYRSESVGGSERVTVNSGSAPALATGTYYVGLTNCSAATVNFTVKALIASDGPNRTDEVRLVPSVPTTNAVLGNVSPNHSVGLLADVQYFIDVPSNARLLNVKLIGTTPGADVDLFVRAGQRVGIDTEGFPETSKFSATYTNVESLELDSSTSPALAPGTRYFIAVANFSNIPSGFQLTATISTAATIPSEAALATGRARSDTLSGLVGFSTISQTNYVLAVPNGAAQLRVELVNHSGSNVDLYIRQGSRVFVNGGVVVRDFASTQNSPVQVVVLDRSSVPSLENDTYYIAVGNRAPTAINFTLTATVLQGGGTQVDTQVFHGNVATNVIAPQQAGGIVIDGDQFFVDVPATVTNLKVRLDGPERNTLVLLGRVGKRVSPTDGEGNDILDRAEGFDSDVFYKYVNGTGTITLARPAVQPYPALQTSRYYFAVANKAGGTAVYQLTFTMSPAPAPAVLAFSAPAYAVAEGGGVTRITVNRTGNTSSAVGVTYTTSNGTASSRSDYSLAQGTLNFAAGETSKSFEVLIANDALVEGGETVGLNLSNPTGGATLGAPGNATLTINDNDAAGGAPNPLDGAQFFVRQHYADFFNRAPDAPGLQFWSNEIAQCGSNAQCLTVKRVNVSGAFFLSIEYQQTGYFVYRLYKASFNRMPRLEEFQPDTQSIGFGVIVGQPNWEPLLESNTQKLLSAWVNRASFRDTYDHLSDADYVDTLIANTGAAFAPSQRAALISGLGLGTETRASVLRKVANDQTFFRKELNPAFVLTQYFGYLRRNADDAPDFDFRGFNFWLTKLNNFGGDFVQAQMVEAFITSPEYRGRFGN